VPKARPSGYVGSQLERRGQESSLQEKGRDVQRVKEFMGKFPSLLVIFLALDSAARITGTDRRDPQEAGLGPH